MMQFWHDNLNIDKLKSWLSGVLLTPPSILIVIFIIGLIFRILSAVQMGWLAEDVFFIDFIEKWFSSNFFQYFFQFQHTVYPPQSPEFGTPPLGMWLQTIGVFLSSIFGFSELLGARLVTIIFAQIGLVFVYKLTKLFFRERVALLAAFFVAISPSIVAIDSSAHVDSFLYTFLIITVYLVSLFVIKRKNKYLYIGALFAGLSVLVKVYAWIIISIIGLLLLFYFIKKKIPLKNLVLSLLIIISVPVVLWAGYRDVDHIQRTLGVVKNVGSLSAGTGTGGIFSEYEGVTGYESKPLLYNFAMIFGRSLPIVSIAVLSLLFILGLDVFRKGRKLKDNQYVFLLVLIFMIVGHFLAVYFLGGPSGVFNRILLPAVLYCILGAVAINYWLERIKSKIVTCSLLSSIILFSFIPIISTSPHFYNAYNSFLIGGVAGGSKIYRVGHGEGLELAAEWLNKNVEPGSIIYAPRINFIGKYLKNNLILAYAPLNEDLDFALSQGSQYVVLHNSFFSGSLKPFIGEIDESSLIKTINIGSYQYIRIYKVFPELSFTKVSTYWNGFNQSGAKSNNSKISIISDTDNVITVQYSIMSGDYVYMKGSIYVPTDAEGIYLSISGNNYGSDDNFYIDIGKEGVGYFRHSLKYNWSGSHDFYIPFNVMKGRFNDLNVFDGNFLKLSMDNYKNDSSGSVTIKDIRFIKRNEQ